MQTNWSLLILDAGLPVKDLSSLAVGDIDGDATRRFLPAVMAASISA